MPACNPTKWHGMAGITTANDVHMKNVCALVDLEDPISHAAASHEVGDALRWGNCPLPGNGGSHVDRRGLG